MSKNNLNADLILHGINSNINELLSLTDLCVIPSRSESFSLFALESMRAGKPVVATNVGGIPEVITDGKTGLLSEPDNPGLLAENILKLYHETELRKRFGQNGRQEFERKFSIDKFYDAYINKYKQLVDGI